MEVQQQLFAEVQQQLAEAQHQRSLVERTAQQQLQTIVELESNSSELQRLTERQELEAGAAKVCCSLLCIQFPLTVVKAS